jgi:peptidoglycan/xylan/chitin deacetylase (PgdA/CDA1 family)
MTTRRGIGLFILIAAFLIPLAAGLHHYVTGVQIFNDIAGPEAATTVPPPQPAKWQAESGGGASRLAILLTDESAPWQALLQGLRAAGMPYRVTRDVGEALRHKAVLIYPLVSGRVLTAAELQALAAHPRNGGTLIAANVLGGLQEVFGFRDTVPARNRFEIRFSEEARKQFDFSEPEEAVIRLGNRENSETAQIGTNGYLAASEVLASFEDGSAAITRRRYGSGAAYALGFDPGSLLLAGQAAPGQDLERDYVNAFAPQNDLLVHLIEQIWREAEPLATTLSPVPGGKNLAAIITHDIDFTKSLANAVAYAEAEAALGVKGTFFIQTKYLRDYNDEIILTDDARTHLGRLRDLGMELASHTVSHSRAFRSFGMGTGRERYPDYRPLAQGRDEASGGTILGELRVSKYLIEQLAKPVEVVSFRPGHLAYPFSLPQALQATGFRYSSSITSGNALSHLPFRLGYERGAEATTDVFEFPVTVEDEKSPFLGMRLEQSLDIARKIERRQGVFVVLVHPNILGHKLDFVRGFIERQRQQAWFGTLAQYGAWWAARDKIALDAAIRDGGIVVSIEAPAPVPGLSLRLPKAWQLAAAEKDVARTADGILLDLAAGRRDIRFELPRQARLP